MTELKKEQAKNRIKLMNMTNQKAEIVVAGHVCLDIIPTLGHHQADMGAVFVPGKLNIVGPATVSTGGTVSNTGIALHRLGVAVRLMGKVGDDPFGRVILDIIRTEGALLTENMVVAKGEQTSYAVVINPPGVDRIFLHCPGTNDTFVADDIDLEQVAGARLFHFGYPTLMQKMREKDGAELVKLFKNVKESGVTTSLDMSYIDPKSEAAKVDWPALLQKVLPYVDIFLPSIEEILFMLDRERFETMEYKTGHNDIIAAVDGALLADLAEQCLAMGAAIVVLKLANQGLYMRITEDIKRLNSMGACVLPDKSMQAWKRRELLAPCFKVNVTGATGSGDCAIAGFLAGFLCGQSPEETITSAVAVGACNVEQADAVSGIPSWAQLQRRVGNGWERLGINLNLQGWRQCHTLDIWVGPNDNAKIK